MNSFSTTAELDEDISGFDTRVILVGSIHCTKM